MKGWPDYVRTTGLVENYDEYAQNYPVGIGDGAARLGSIKTYDMRGRVWWMDDFEAATLHWLTQNAGVGGAQGLTSNYVRNGEQALELQANTGAGRRSGAVRIFQLPRSIPIGLEFHFSQEANFGIIEMSIAVDDAVNRTIASFRIEEATGQLQYTNAAGGWTNSGLQLGLSDVLCHFHSVKIVFDYDTDEWIRILYDDQEIDLERESMEIIGTTGNRYLVVAIDNDGDNVNNARAIFDDVIITTMEPD